LRVGTMPCRRNRLDSRRGVLLPRDAPWLATYIDELTGFPNARHDDQVDSTSQALEWLWQRINIGIPPKRPNPTRPQGAPLFRRRQ
jgi:hypothetical protein